MVPCSVKAWLSGTSVAAAVLVWASMVTAAPAPLPNAVPELDSLIPRDAETVLVLNVRQALDSAVVKTYALEPLKAALKQNDKLLQLATLLGIDPLKDVEAILLATSNGATNNKILLAARGRFNQDKFRIAADAFAKKNPEILKIHTEGKVLLYELVENGTSDFIALADDNTLVVSTTKELTLGACKKGPGDKLAPALQAAVDKVKSSKATLWLATIVPDEMRKNWAENDETKEWGPKVENVTGTLNLTDGIELSLTVRTTEKAAVAQLLTKAGQCKLLVGLVLMSNEHFKRFADLATENLKFNSKGTEAFIELQLSADLLEKVPRK